MAACLQSLCVIVLLATLYVGCHGHCVVRTYMPSGCSIMECPSGCSTGSSDDCSSSNDDLATLLLLARALEMEKSHNAKKDIDVNALLDTLIHAIVCIAKPESSAGGHSSGYPKSPKGNGGHKPPATGSGGSGKPGSGGSGKPGSGGSGKPGVVGILDSVNDTVGGLLTGRDAGGVDEILDSVTGTVDNLLGDSSRSHHNHNKEH